MRQPDIAIAVEQPRGVGDQLRAARALRRFTQEELAHRAGLSAVSVGAIEKGGDVRLSTLRRLSRALGLEVHELLTFGM